MIGTPAAVEWAAPVALCRKFGRMMHGLLNMAELARGPAGRIRHDTSQGTLPWRTSKRRLYQRSAIVSPPEELPITPHIWPTARCKSATTPYVEFSETLRPFWCTRLFPMQRVGNVAPGDRVVDLPEATQLNFGRIERFQLTAEIGQRPLCVLQSLRRLMSQLRVTVEGRVPQPRA